MNDASVCLSAFWDWIRSRYRLCLTIGSALSLLARVSHGSKQAETLMFFSTAEPFHMLGFGLLVPEARCRAFEVVESVRRRRSQIWTTCQAGSGGLSCFSVAWSGRADCEQPARRYSPRQWHADARTWIFCGRRSVDTIHLLNKSEAITQMSASAAPCSGDRMITKVREAWFRLQAW